MRIAASQLPRRLCLLSVQAKRGVSALAETFGAQVRVLFTLGHYFFRFTFIVSNLLLQKFRFNFGALQHFVLQFLTFDFLKILLLLFLSFFLLLFACYLLQVLGKLVSYWLWRLRRFLLLVITFIRFALNFRLLDRFRLLFFHELHFPFSLPLRFLLLELLSLLENLVSEFLLFAPLSLEFFFDLLLLADPHILHLFESLVIAFNEVGLVLARDRQWALLAVLDVGGLGWLRAHNHRQGRQLFDFLLGLERSLQRLLLQLAFLRVRRR